MRIQVRIPPKIWDQLCLLAQTEHRPPKYQVELLLWQAIDQAALPQGGESRPQEVVCANTE
jgi:hypothetical protein